MSWIIEKNTDSRKREEWVDGLRAVAVLFVIFGHQIPGNTIYYVFTSPIKIPLLFMITGYVFNDARTSIVEFLRYLLRRLIIPWLCFTLPLAILYVPDQGLKAFPMRFLGLIAGEIEWYMPCCVIAMTIWFVIRRICRTVFATSAFAFAVFGIGIIASRSNVLNYAMVNRAMLMQLFILEGHLFRVYRKHLNTINRNIVILLCVLYLAMGFISFAVWPGKSLDVHLNRYYCPPFCFSMMLIGCFSAFMVTCRLPHIPRILCFIGQNTLVYYLLHAYTIFLGEHALRLIGVCLPDSVSGALIRTLIACIGCGIEAILINRYLPEIVGKKRRR